MKAYLKKNCFLWMALVIVTALIHGTMFFGTSIGIDTEVALGLQNSFYESWLGIGRYGLVWMKTIMDTTVFNPFFTAVLVTFLLPAVCITWTYYFGKITEKENIFGIVFFSLIVLTYTIMTEQLYFKIQAVEVLTAMMLTAVSLLLVYDGTVVCAGRKRIIYFLTAVLINVLDFGVYQVLVPLFIFGAVAGFFLFNYAKDQKDEKKIWSLVLGYAGVFLGSMFVNQFISRIFFSDGAEYLGNQIAWGRIPFTECMQNILSHIREVVFGTQIYYVKTFSVFALLLVITAIVLWGKKKGRKGNVLGFFSLLLVFLAPFYMTILCGQTPVVRSQLVMPFAAGFFAYTVFGLKTEKKWYFYIGIVVSLLTVYLQLKYTTMLHYSDQVRYESDVRVATQISNRIDALENGQKTYPVVFFGAHEAELNPSCIRGEVIGYSFFEWDANTYPIGIQGTRRILCFMQALGMNYGQADMEQTQRAYEAALEMPVWPERDSVQLQNDVIVVKLGEIISE